ncbi:MAG: hypothetical protein DPW09_15375 [Anaerolineae bacterium]|nr:hypothetical protein [Anaerolineales bacterium]MCQ3974821.1 hypothetical protein [Anaerolineae bacterium]
MSRWGCIGLLVGSIIGVLLLMGLIRSIQPAIPAVAVQPAVAAPDLTLFLSEESVSRSAAQALAQPAVINFEPGGQVILTTPISIAGWEPVIDLGLSLEQQGNQVVSRLHWAQLGWLRLPARWLPPELVELGTQPGQQLSRQIPPQFNLISLTTAADGITLQVDWVGR